MSSGLVFLSEHFIYGFFVVIECMPMTILTFLLSTPEAIKHAPSGCKFVKFVPNFLLGLAWCSFSTFFYFAFLLPRMFQLFRKNFFK